MSGKIPVSVLIMARNEEEALPRCLQALNDFEEIIVVDSYSTDKTAEIARRHGARVEQFTWNGQYPKKSQWALDTVQTKYDWVFLVDADEIVTAELIKELKKTDFSCAGYFVRGRYIWNSKMLKHGLVNNKLCLFDKTKLHYPTLDDLDLTEDWEMEMHYQPVLKDGFENERLGQIRAPLLHNAYADPINWEAKHQFYARWEAGMILKNAFPKDPSPLREGLKRVFRGLPLRGALMFIYSYVFKLGFLDSRAGYNFARARARYYQMVSEALSASSKEAVSGAAVHTSHSAPQKSQPPLEQKGRMRA